MEGGDLGIGEALPTRARVVALSWVGLDVAAERHSEDALPDELPAIGEVLELGATDGGSIPHDPVVASPEFAGRPVGRALAEDPATGRDLAHGVLVVDEGEQLLAKLLDGLLPCDPFHAGLLLVHVEPLLS
jgi:hypothetical protein